MVYQQTGAAPIVAKLAAFHVSAEAYRPPPAIDEGRLAPDGVQQASVPDRRVPQPAPSTPSQPSVRRVSERPKQTVPANIPGPTRIAKSDPAPTRIAARDSAATRIAKRPLPNPTPRGAARSTSSGEAAVRGFYGALGSGNGAAASSHVIPEKRSSGAYSPGAMSRFYGRLPQPIRLTSVAPVGDGRYRVTYRYSAGRSHCNGTAVVRLANRGGVDLISSIRSLTGC